MLQIKTVLKQLEFSGAFDEEVNAAQAEGWRLTKREVLLLPNFGAVLYAELDQEREATDQEREATDQERGRTCDNCEYLYVPGSQEPCNRCFIRTKWAPAQR